MQINKSNIYEELKWVSDGSGRIELLVDTGFMSINNPLIRYQIDKKGEELRSALEDFCKEYSDPLDRVDVSEASDDYLWEMFVTCQDFSITDGEYDYDEPVSIEDANKYLNELQNR